MSCHIDSFLALSHSVPGPGDVGDDVAKTEAIPEVSATWSKMLAQEMHSATRLNKMLKPAVWGFRYRMGWRCNFPPNGQSTA